ncbi:hypothetical protein D3C85_1422830 [compost metagenome]
MLVEDGLGNAHLAGNVIHRHQVEPFPRQDARGRIQDRVLAQPEGLVLEADLAQNTHL